MPVDVKFGFLPIAMTKATIQRLRKPLILLLLPVALLTSRPMVGCICSDGTYKVSCEKLVGSFLWLQATKDQGLSCCSTTNFHKCPACNNPAESETPGTCDIASSESRCECRGIENNLKLTSLPDLKQNRDRHFVEFCSANCQTGVRAVVQEFGSPLRNDLPPINRVVLFLHLTI